MEYILGGIIWGAIFGGAWKWFLRDMVMPHPITKEAKRWWGAWWKASRVPEEAYYAHAAAEINNGKIRQGLWAKALAESMGDEAKARGLYIKLRVQAIRSEATETFRSNDRQPDSKPIENVESLPKITICCPSCTASLRVAAGKRLKVTCPKCRHSFETRT